MKNKKTFHGRSMDFSGTAQCNPYDVVETPSNEFFTGV